MSQGRQILGNGATGQTLRVLRGCTGFENLEICIHLEIPSPRLKHSDQPLGPLVERLPQQKHQLVQRRQRQLPIVRFDLDVHPLRLTI